MIGQLTSLFYLVRSLDPKPLCCLRGAMKFLPALLVFGMMIVGSYAEAPAIPAPLFAEGTARIGTFNIEHLGGTRFKKERSAEQLLRIADLIDKELRYDVVALEEVNVDSPAYKTITDKLAETGWKFFHTATGNEQRVAVGYRTPRATLIGEPRELGEPLVDPCYKDKPGAPPEPKILRSPLLANFRIDKFDFYFVAVHLKSNRSEMGELCDDELRIKHCQVIVDEVKKLTSDGPERDFVLAGDFNSDVGNSSLKPLYDYGFVSLSDPKNLIDGSGGASYLKGKYRGTIDHVKILPGPTRESRKGTMYFYLPGGEKAFIKEVSDHAPIVTTFQVDQPDDD